jgi:hypothetical protein
MWTPVLPRQIDNAYRGSRLALWILGVVVLGKTAISLNSIFNGRVVASSADGIPLDAYPGSAAAAVVSLFGIWGVGHLVLCLLTALALVRYRSVVPFMFLVLLLEQLARKAVLHFLPITRSGVAPGSYVNQVLLAAMVIGFGLSLWAGRGREPRCE